MAEPIRIRASIDEGGVTEVKVRATHEMETGQRRDASGNAIPASFIQEVTATCNGRTVMSAQWGPAVSKDPFFSFRFKGAAKGDKVRISWVDSKGDKRTDESTIA
jgi:sulfur-oxidizing protein SoxZ